MFIYFFGDVFNLIKTLHLKNLDKIIDIILDWNEINKTFLLKKCLINNIEQMKLFNNLLLFFQNEDLGNIIFIFLPVFSKLNFDEVIK